MKNNKIIITLRDKKSKPLTVSMLGLLIIVTGAVVYLILNNLQMSKAQSANLDSVYDDLSVLQERLLSSFGLNAQRTSLSKVCYQSSAKFNEGAITCGSEGRFMLSGDNSYENKANQSISVLNGSKKFAYKAVEEVTDDKDETLVGFAVHFKHQSTGILCNALLERQEYSITCLKTVTNFLPGYTIVK